MTSHKKTNPTRLCSTSTRQANHNQQTMKVNTSPKLQLLALLAVNKITGCAFKRPETGATCFANIGEGTHENGVKAYVSDAGTTSRYLFYEPGSTADNCVVAAGANEPLGVSDDLADANNLDVPIAINLLGAIRGTQRAISDGSVTNGKRIAVKKDGSGKATVPGTGAGSFWVVGKALIPTDAVVGNGDAFEFIPFQPQQVTY